MKITHLALALALAACSKGSKQDTFPERQLGESTASPGANASKPAPVTPDDPSVMNVSATITPQMQSRATAAPLPAQTQAPGTATSSTPVPPPADIAPPSTATEPNRPGVFTPPPVTPSTPPPPTPAPVQTGPTPAPTPQQ